MRFSKFFAVPLISSSIMAYSGSALAEELSAEEKKAKLNALIAEAAKQAGIELENEEITIVIKKKSKEEKSSLDSISEDDASGAIVITDEGDNNDAASQVSKQETEQTPQDIDEATTLSTDALVNETTDDNSSNIETLTESKQSDTAGSTASEPTQITGTSNVTASEGETTSQTQQAPTPNTTPELATEEITEKAPEKQLQSQDTPSTTEAVTVENTVFDPQPLAPQEQQHTPIPAPEYFGDYISPERQMNAYYSSDLLEAIESAKTQSRSTTASDLSEFGLSAMEQGEMSDLVVEGALDATAAGDVSTTSLKTAVVVPDNSILDDANENAADDVLDDNIETSQQDLSQRIKKALAKIGETSDRGSSSSNNRMGALTANNVNVTATFNSRISNNSVSNYRPTNLNNTNF